MRLRKETGKDKVRKMILRTKGLPKHLVISLVDAERIIAFNYRNWFEIPKVNVRMKWLKNSEMRKYFSKFGIYALVSTFYINGKRLRGWAEWDSKILATDLSSLEVAFNNKLTSVINTIQPNASRDKNRAKRVIEKFFKVKVKVI